MMKSFYTVCVKGKFLLYSLWEESTNEIRKTKKWHFAHKKEDSCLAFYEAESMYHRHGKELLYRWFKRQNFHVDIEHYLPEIQQRPDILIESREKGCD